MQKKLKCFRLYILRIYKNFTFCHSLPCFWVYTDRVEKTRTTKGVILSDIVGVIYLEKLTQKQRQEIILSYKLDNSKENINNLCSRYNITKQYIFKLAKKNTSEEIEKSIIESKNEFTKRANEIIKLLLDRIEEKALNDDKTTLSQLSTTLGILYDKSRLENNLSTENKSINININIEK